ncbi:MAG: DUF4276 family protein [Chlorobiaceae bacterium]|nr:DUF4276 family protein [Chlorobiaceae bacterium]
MKTLVFFLEEPSAQRMLEGVLPKLISADVYVRYVVFQGKSDLEKHLVRKLRYWQLPDSVFVVMRDQDASDCLDIKMRLVDLCRQSGRNEVLVRIACRELESFYLGDLEAVERGLGIRGLAAKQGQSKFRNPDRLGSPSEELNKLTNGIYQKVAGSRAIGGYLNLENNSSRSFIVLLSGIKKVLGN